MNFEDFFKYLNQPGEIGSDMQKELGELVRQYPYFNPLRWAYLKSLHSTDSIYFDTELKKSSAYATDRRQLYYFIFPEENSAGAKEFQRNEGSGSYFDMMDSLERRGESDNVSLSRLAARLKDAREKLSDTEEQGEAEVAVSVAKPAELAEVKDISAMPAFRARESEAKQLIRERKYHEAIEILEELYLINPKKSIYFADQIRFLRKIVEKQT